MSKIKHIYLNEYPYMITTVTRRRVPLFNDPFAADVVLRSILFGRRQNWYKLLGFVVMPDHLHLIIIPGDKNVSEGMKSLKAFSARKINSLFCGKGSIWQRGFYDYILETEEKVISRIRYIEENPLRKGLVDNLEDYKYSSARFREETDLENIFY